MAVASAVDITLSQERSAPSLQRRAGKLTLPYRDVQRAKVVLHVAEGMSNVEIAGRLEMCSKVVGQWRADDSANSAWRACTINRGRVAGAFPPHEVAQVKGDRLRAAQDARRRAIALQPV